MHVENPLTKEHVHELIYQELHQIPSQITERDKMW